MDIIDTDIHQSWQDMGEVYKRMPAYFREMNYRLPLNVSVSPVGVQRADAVGDEGEAPGSSYQKMKAQHLDPFNIVKGVLAHSSMISLSTHPHTEYAKHLARAYNEAMIETWLTYDERLYGAMIVAPQDPQAAAEDIRRFGQHPRIVEVQISSATRIPLGQNYYWPIYEAAQEMGLPFAVHPGAEGSGISNGFPAGVPSTYLEWHTNLSQNAMGQVVSLICEGVFEKFPKLKFIVKEAGLAWIPGVLWRFDKNWKALRSSVPWVKKLPSEYIVENMRFTTQPIEEPENPDHLLQLFDMIHADKTLMFASDYPHWDNDSPKYCLPSRIPESMRERIFHKTAEETYNFNKAS